MRYTEITYYNMKDEKNYTITVKEDAEAKDFYHHDIVITINGILSTRDADGEQVAIITDMRHYL